MGELRTRRLFKCGRWEVGDNRQERWWNMSEWEIWFSIYVFGTEHLKGVRSCAGTFACFFLLWSSQKMRYEIWYFKNPPFIDVEPKIMTVEGFFPKIVQRVWSKQGSQPEPFGFHDSTVHTLPHWLDFDLAFPLVSLFGLEGFLSMTLPVLTFCASLQGKMNRSKYSRF